jgi:probable rRNA maturation factor
MPEVSMGAERALDIDIAVEGGDWPAEDVLQELAGRAIRAGMAAVSDVEGGQTVSLLFTDDEEIQDLNARFRNKDRPTNVLSFPGADNVQIPGIPPHLGDIALAYETVRREAEAEGKTFEDHLTHLVVHGFLHLAGYDHEEADEAEEMEDLERLILRGLAIRDPYD